MNSYAKLNENNICVGIIGANNFIATDKHIRIDEYNHDYLWRKYDKIENVWSEEKYEPQSTAPLTEFEEIQQRLTEMETQMLIQGGII